MIRPTSELLASAQHERVQARDKDSRLLRARGTYFTRSGLKYCVSPKDYTAENAKKLRELRQKRSRALQISVAWVVISFCLAFLVYPLFPQFVMLGMLALLAIGGPIYRTSLSIKVARLRKSARPPVHRVDPSLALWERKDLVRLGEGNYVFDRFETPRVVRVGGSDGRWKYIDLYDCESYFNASLQDRMRKEPSEYRSFLESLREEVQSRTSIYFS